MEVTANLWSNNKILSPNLEKAIKIAVEAHTGQLEKNGNPYFLHPFRVMLSLKTQEEKIVGVLHDVVEDCSEAGFDWTYIKNVGFSSKIIQGLESVTKTPDEEHRYKQCLNKGDHEAALAIYMESIDRARKDSIGRNVKIADLKDNLDISRIPNPTDKDHKRMERYSYALAYLTNNAT